MFGHRIGIEHADGLLRLNLLGHRNKGKTFVLPAIPVFDDLDCGDGRPATAEKGERWLADRAQALAKIIRAIKNDAETKRLQDEFFGKL